MSYIFTQSRESIIIHIDNETWKMIKNRSTPGANDECANFQSISSLNFWMNIFSGNLLPMTSDDSSFSIIWRIYSVVSWLLIVSYTGALISGTFFIPKEKALRDGMISMVIVVEVTVMIARIHTQRGLVQRLIRNINDILRVPDETMKNVLTATLKSMKAPLQFYWIVGAFAICIWCCIPFPLTFHRSNFYYVDYQSPVAYTKEPISTDIFILINILLLINNLILFFKKVAIDVYMTHLVLLIMAQHRYTALKLVSIFRDNNPQDNHDHGFQKKYYSKLDHIVMKELKTLCQHHISIIHLTLMLKKLLSLNFSLIYMNGVLRFCSIAIMLFAIPSASIVEGFAVISFACGEIVQLYILCSCVQKLLDASTEITDEAFHEGWYQFGPGVKRIFMLVIMASNVGFKLSTFERFNLSLPSFMMILNQSYSIALLILKMT